MDPDPGKSLRWRVSSLQLQHPGKGELRTQRRERQGQRLGLLTRFPIRHGGVCETGQRPKLAYAKEKSNLLRPKGAPPQEAAPPGTGDQTLVVNADPDLSDVSLDPWKRHRGATETAGRALSPTGAEAAAFPPWRRLLEAGRTTGKFRRLK